MHPSSARKPVLPNLKFHKKSKSPENVRTLNPYSHHLLVQKLSDFSESSANKSADFPFRPGSIDANSKNELIVGQTFTSRFEYNEHPPARKISQEAPTLKYSNIIMSKDLAVMAQVRRSLIGEISSIKIPNLTGENLPAIRNSFCPKELQNIGDSLQLVQKSKALSERKTRHPFATGAYAIRALHEKAQKKIMKKLRDSLPEGSRFFKYT